MCLSKSAQPMKFIIPFMVISCQENFKLSEPCSSRSSGCWEAQLHKGPAFYPAGAKRFITTYLPLGILWDIFALKENTSHLLFLIKESSCLYWSVLQLRMVTYSLDPQESSSPQTRHWWFCTHWCFQKKTDGKISSLENILSMGHVYVLLILLSRR